MHAILRIKDGELQGAVEENVLGGKYFAFRSIPYARPPLGEFRFKDPEPVVPWTGIRDATKFVECCPQFDEIAKQTIGGEDCLFLNVYTPSINTDLKLPVMFWVHGGSFRIGSSETYPADYLVKRDVVVVTINYRLGVFGFLNVDHEAATGNQGLKDQVMALKWVRENIAKFSGDPNNVTVFGESAGGVLVHFLALSPLSKGLLHRVISQSGCGLSAWATVRESNRKMAIRIAAELGFESEDPVAIVDFFRTVEAYDLVKAEESSITHEYDRKYLCPIGPSFDTKSTSPFFPEHPDDLCKQGVHVPFLIGYTSNEGAFLTRKGVSFRIIRYDMARFNDLNNNFKKFVNPVDTEFLEEKGMTPDDLKFHYYGGEVITNRNLQKFADFVSDSVFIRGIYRVVDVQLAKSKFPTYIYKFSYEPPSSAIKSHLPKELRGGATHCEELMFLFCQKQFGKLSLEPGSPDYLIMQRVTELWTNFARTGNPTPKLTETLPLIWEPVTKGDVYQQLNIDETLSMEYVEKGKQRWDWAPSKSRL